MPVELIKEKYTGAISVVEIGRTEDQGGTRKCTIKIGGETSMPFLYGEGSFPHKPVMAMEILDREPAGWEAPLVQALGDESKDPISWGRKCVDVWGAEALCVRLLSAHPDNGDRPVKEVISFLERLAKEITVPLIVIGSGDHAKDRTLMPEVSHALKKENCLLGIAVQDEYKTLTASCLADGHSIIAESPIDINIAKQINILISDMGFDKKKIVMHPTTASLGYGMEYVYSIMERSRLAAFAGDWTMAMPMVLFVGQETWRVKESKESAELGISWEFTTAATLLQSGANMLVMRHPTAASELKKYIDTLIKR